VAQILMTLAREAGRFMNRSGIWRRMGGAKGTADATAPANRSYAPGRKINPAGNLRGRFASAQQHSRQPWLWFARPASQGSALAHAFDVGGVRVLRHTMRP